MWPGSTRNKTKARAFSHPTRKSVAKTPAMIPNTNDGSDRAPRVRCYMNLMALHDMPEFAGRELTSSLEAIRDAGFEGVQFAEPPDECSIAVCRRLGLRIAGSGRVNEAADAAAVACRLADEGMECGTLHVGWGLEGDSEAARLIEAVLSAADRHGVPLYVETHRATIFQDMWRTVRFLQAFPELRFNGDFSHWYTGQEMVYGGFEKKFAFIAPVLKRVRFLHGRIGNPGCIQVYIEDGDSATQPSAAHFRQLWRASFEGFLENAAPGDYICFTPELLASSIYYARTFKSPTGENLCENNRWKQSLLLAEMGRECFGEAVERFSASAHSDASI
jgi:hypothetical protein